jgi:DNA ligase 3
MERSDTENLPKWLNCKRTMIPDLIAKDPYKMPVWEITGKYFSNDNGKKKSNKYSNIYINA